MIPDNLLRCVCEAHSSSIQLLCGVGRVISEIDKLVSDNNHVPGDYIEAAIRADNCSREIIQILRWLKDYCDAEKEKNSTITTSSND